MTLGSCGRYELLERIGAGGMAEVFKARRMDAGGLTGIVAIKRVHPALWDDERFAQMFLDEAKIAMSLSHGNLVAFHELGEERGQRFLVMEHVDGIDLERWLKRRAGPLPVPVAVHVAAEVLAGLDYAHRKRGPDGKLLGLVHRDVSPANVLLSREGSVKLADFGIAKAAIRANVLTGGGVLKGKLAYLSPEQARGEPLDPRSDVFALGLVLHEMLTGHRVYGMQDSHRTLAQALAAQVRPVGEIVGVPEGLDRILTKALARDAGDRHESAAAMRKELLALQYGSAAEAAGGAEVSALVREAADGPGAQAVALDGALRAALGRDGPAVTAPTRDIKGGPRTQAMQAPRGAPSRRRIPMSGLTVGLAVVALGALAFGFWPGAPSTSTERGRRSRIARATDPHTPTEPARAADPVPAAPAQHPAPPTTPVEQATSDPPTKAPAPASTDAGGPNAETSARTAAPGILHLGARPWAYATITKGGRAYASRRPTPIHDLRLPPGRYRVELDNPVQGLRTVQFVQIRSGQSVTRVIDLTSGSN